VPHLILHNFCSALPRPQPRRRTQHGVIFTYLLCVSWKVGVLRCFHAVLLRGRRVRSACVRCACVCVRACVCVCVGLCVCVCVCVCCMLEAQQSLATPCDLCRLFVLLHLQGTPPGSLLERFRAAMSADFVAVFDADPNLAQLREFQLTRPQRFGGVPTLWSRWLLALGDGTLPQLDPVTGAERPDQPMLRVRGGAHVVALPVADGVRVFTDQTEFMQWVHPPASLATGSAYTVARRIALSSLLIT
jgi:hypothetical protein